MIRLANINDLEAILEIVEDARKQISNLNFKQWTKESNYPNAKTFATDIVNKELYVYEDGQVLAVMSLVKSINPDYEIIDGKWLNDNKYYTVHRLAVKAEARHLGLGSKMLEYAKILAFKDNVSLRIDTHLKNIPMINLIKKANFSYCGIIKIIGEQIEPERLAYETLN